MSIRTLMVRRSQNAKTGPVDISTYRTQGSCPRSCPLFGKGCYAENRGARGRPSPFGIAEKGTIIDQDYGPLIDALDALGRYSIVRFNVSGDYLLEDGTPDMAYIEATNHARRSDVLSYTHAWRTLDPAWFETTTRPNASCDTLVDVAVARDAGWATVLVDPGLDYAAESGFVTCLYDAMDIQCTACRLCSKTERKGTVVFPVHGSRRRIAAETLKEAA
jgi:hypothetical protein